MNYIWVFLVISSIIIAIYTGRIQEVTQAIIENSKLGVEISISLIGIMAFWLGIVKLAEKSGLINIIAKLIQPITNFLFKELPKGHPSLGNIAMNISANALGITNAATPIGIKAMQEMQELNKHKKVATNPMCTFLAINTAGFQIVPTTVIGILIASGATNPTEIVGPTIITTLIGCIAAIFIVKFLEKFFPINEKEVTK